MKTALAAAAVVVNTLVLLAALFFVQPFELASAALDRAFGAPPKWKDVEQLYRDPRTQEISRGDHPLASLNQLAAYWSAHPGRKRVVFIGNSQMHSINLAPGEGPPTGPEKAYVDLIPQKPGQPEYLFYRISLGGLSYSEALWYTLYLLSDPRVKPDTLVVQINYQALLQAGLREGMLELLREPAFRARVKAEADAAEPYSDTFQEALRRDAELQAQAATGDAARARHSTWIAFGEATERAARRLLSGVPGFDGRHEIKGSFEQMMYRGRVYVLRLKPSTPRSAPAVRLLRSQMELEELIRAARAAGVCPIFFLAPLNPEVNLYRTAEDRANYRAFTTRLSTSYHVRVWDLEGLLSDRYWGRELNGPDPLHFGRDAHRVMAGSMADILADSKDSGE